MKFMPRGGLEPPHLAAHEPESCVSTNSTTWAWEGKINFGLGRIKFRIRPTPKYSLWVILGFAAFGGKEDVDGGDLTARQREEEGGEAEKMSVGSAVG